VGEVEEKAKDVLEEEEEVEVRTEDEDVLQDRNNLKEENREKSNEVFF